MVQLRGNLCGLGLGKGILDKTPNVPFVKEKRINWSSLKLKMSVPQKIL
jgi:hypothetical protein